MAGFDAVDNIEKQVYGHYTGVEPGIGTPGCREFWVSCSSHLVVFEEPDGAIIERGQPALSDIQTWKDDGTGRYIYYLGETEEFGRYPQSKVTNSTTIANLNSMAGSLPTSNNSYLWTPYNWYISSSNINKFGWFIDIDVDNDNLYDYRGVYFTSYRPYFISYSSSTTYSSQDDNGYNVSTTYWFTYEPLQWRVVNNDPNNILIMTSKIIGSEQFSTYTKTGPTTKTDYQGNTRLAYPNNYQFSDLRTFLNVDFYDLAFNDDEANLIKTTEVHNDAESAGNSTSSYTCNNTQDKVFALSYSEARNSSYGFYIGGRPLKATDYAASLGCTLNSKKCGAFWFRSVSEDDPESVKLLYNNGDFGHFGIAKGINGVVPALRLNK